MSEVIIRKQVNRFILGEAWACFFLRMFIGMRLMLAGLTKFKTVQGGEIKYDFSKSASMDGLQETMANNTLLGTQPGLLEFYVKVLPFVLIFVGAWVIAGWFQRLSLIAAGAIFLSLSFGLMLLPDDLDSTLRGIELLCVAGALCLVRYNILAMDNLWDIIIRKKDVEEVVEEKGESAVEEA